MTFRITLAAAILAASPAFAQNLDVPFEDRRPLARQAAECPSSYVDGLDPNGDNFLAVRSGPGSGYRMLDQIHSGDVVFICAARMPWVGVFYSGANIANGYRATHPERLGWVHSNWLRDLAG